MRTQASSRKAQGFLEYLDAWAEKLPALPLAAAIPDPARAAFFSEDIINGFCHRGPLAGPRVRALIAPIVSLMQRVWDRGVREFVLSQDRHEPNAVEFAQWPPHCVRGTDEAEAVPEIKALPFFNRMTVLPKNSINAALGTDLQGWLATHPEIDTCLVAGDCTDLCVYQLAMHLRLDANARQLARRVILPANCVDTFDFPIAAAMASGALPHNADLLHLIFLYHMALNGVEVVREIT